MVEIFYFCRQNIFYRSIMSEQILKAPDAVICHHLASGKRPFRAAKDCGKFLRKQLNQQLAHVVTLIAVWYKYSPHIIGFFCPRIFTN